MPKLYFKTGLIAGLVIAGLLVFSATGLASSGYTVGNVPDVGDRSWAKLGTVVVDAPSSALTNGDLLFIRLTEKSRFYESAPIISGPALSTTAAGKQLTYTIQGDQKGQLRIVVPEKVKGQPNDLFAATGHNPFHIGSSFNNEIIIALQNYTDNFGENRFLIHADNAYAVSDDDRSVKMYFDASPGAGWPLNEIPVAGYDFRCPLAPTELGATTLSATQVELCWQDNSKNETGFKILAKLTGGSYEEIARVDADITTYIVSGLEPTSSYSFQLIAFNENCDSTPSNIARAATLKAPLPPDDILIFKVGSHTYYLNETPQEMDTAPVIIESKTYLPIRHLAEALGAEVEWDQAEYQISISLGKSSIRLWIGKPMAEVDGMKVWIDPENPQVVPIITTTGRTILPLRFIGESLGCQVLWDDSREEIKVSR